MKNLLILFLFTFNTFNSNITNAQVFIELSASDTIICPGDSVYLTTLIVNSNNTFYYEDFNSGVLDTTLFLPNNSIDYSNPCGPGLPGSLIHCWFGSLSYFPRSLETTAININSSFSISFDMRYAADENSTDCENPDQPNEGVHFQYSLTPYTTWHDINYWIPNNTYSGQLYSWAQYSEAIPQAAYSSASKFRWWQDLSSGNTWDHWGLDNIMITSDTGLLISWSHDSLLSSQFSTIYPLSDTFYIVTVSDTINGFSASDSVFIHIAVIDTSITQINDTLLVAEANASYQWIFCNTNLPLPDEIMQSLFVTQSGSYAVDIINAAGCYIRSNCVQINIDGINENLDADFSIYPNPSNNRIIINGGNKIINQITILDMSGKVIFSFYPNENYFQIDLSALPNGKYFMSIKSENSFFTKEITKIK